MGERWRKCYSAYRSWRSSWRSAWPSMPALICGIFRGHADQLVFEPGRAYLKCGGCGRETAGWDLTFQPTTQKAGLFR